MKKMKKYLSLFYDLPVLFDLWDSGPPPLAKFFVRGLGLQRGGRVQIQGYTSLLRDGMEVNRRFQSGEVGFATKTRNHQKSHVSHPKIW